MEMQKDSSLRNKMMLEEVMQTAAAHEKLTRDLSAQIEEARA